MTTAAREAAHAYLTNGWCPVPIAKGAKKPRLGTPAAWRALWQRPCWAPERPKAALPVSEICDGDDWQWLRLRPEDLEQVFANGCSVGVNLGEPSSDLTDVDCDAPEVLHHAGAFLPGTRTFGRASKPESHWLFRAAGAVTAQFKEPKSLGGTMLVELRATAPARVGQRIGGSQTVFPGSTHPSGEAIEWTAGTAAAPTEIPAGELRKRVGHLAVATLLERHCPAALPAFLEAPGAVPAGVPPELVDLVAEWLQIQRERPAPQPQRHVGSAGAEGLTSVRSLGVVAVARALGLEVEEREGKQAGIRPCPACGDTQRGHTTPDKRPPVEATSDGGGWHCYRCDAKGDAVDLAARVIVRTSTPTAQEWREVRERCAALNLCAPVRRARETPPPPGDNDAPMDPPRRPRAVQVDPPPPPGADGPPEPPPFDPPDEEGENKAYPYEARASGLIRWKTDPKTKEEEAQALTNFDARVLAEVTEDDGVETRKVFELESVIHGRRGKFCVPAKDFSSLGWVIQELGSKAVIYPPRSNVDHARTAIQELSKSVTFRRAYTHMGWRQVADRWVYLHAGGAIGADGPVPGVDVALSGPSLQRYMLPAPPAGAALRDAVRSSMGFLDLAPHRVTIPLFAAIWRAAMWESDFSLGVVGHTGSFKSALSACAQQHYGPEMDGRHFPAAWTATENALEGMAFAAKDAMLGIDDFAPGGSQVQVQQLHAKAERILRAQGNQSGRSRMRADATLRPDKPPRGLIVWSGEDIPRGQSVRARALIVELERHDVDTAKLTAFQGLGAAGVPAQAFAGFVQWFAGRRAEQLRTRTTDLNALRDRAEGSGSHRRTPEILANLMLGLRAWAAYARDVGALEAGAWADLEDVAWDALGASAALQAEAQAASDPVNRFFSLLSSAISSGAAHVASDEGAAPAERPEGWGWRVVDLGYNGRDWRPGGARIGWIDRENLYLDTASAMSVVSTLGQRTEDALNVSATTLRKRLNERGMLLTTDPSASCLEVRRTLEGQKRRVLHLLATRLFQDKDETQDKALTQDETPNGENGAGWAGCGISKNSNPAPIEQE